MTTGHPFSAPVPASPGGEPAVAVVGAGWAGLAAAVELARAGVAVTVYEAAAIPGGRARRVLHAGAALDNGQHLLLGAYRETLRLVALVTDPARVLHRQPLRLVSGSGFRLACPPLPAPLHLLAGLLGARGLSWADRLAAVRFMARARRAGFRAPPGATVSALLQAWGHTPALTRHLWEPLCLSALNTPLDEADATTFLAVLRDGLTRARADADLLLPRADLSQVFPEPAVRFVSDHGGQVRLGCAVTGLHRDGTSLRVESAAGRATFRHVILAADPVRAGRLLQGLSGAESAERAIDALAHEPITTVYLRLAAPGAGLGEAMLGDEAGPAQWFFDRERLCGQAGWVAGVVSASSAWRSRGHELLAAAVHAQLQALTGRAPALLDQFVVSERRATFRCVPGLERPGLDTGVPGLLLAGDYVRSEYPATLEAAVRSGVACAHRVLQSSQTHPSRQAA